MKLLGCLALLALAADVVVARQPLDFLRRKQLASRQAMPIVPPPIQNRAPKLNFYTDKTKEFYVPGTSIPDVDFDVGESYAGLLPISSKPHETRKLFFWFFPSVTGKAPTDELVIWLNGGPGCSSMEGLLQENGPFLWQSGTFKPVPNDYSWHKVANMLWVEQPVGTGFTQGNPNIRNEEDMAAQFLGFLEQWLKTFDLEGRTTYVTGESYAGFYVPYIVDAMYKRNDTSLFNPKGLMIYDPSLSYDAVQEQMTAYPFVESLTPLFALNATTMADFKRRHESCGYANFLEKYLVFPPPGVLPTPPQLETSPECDLWTDILNAALQVNPCFNIYHVSDGCPLLWDVLGFPGSSDYIPPGATVYFNRTDVQKVLHVPPTVWQECTDTNVFPKGDGSLPSALSVLPDLIDKNERTLIGHGLLDYVLIKDGSLLAIQNMTWGGAQGFQERPSTPFVIPYEGRGTAGIYHTERKLTWFEIDLSGHMVPEYQPTVAYRQLEYLLGRIKEL
ncbi:putative pheromone processing carboxypeptidase [Sphaerosporella brunnea]|uniref:Carboxypeptidase n=1 Tax=Sphaerosporella brunnea TaxID=1250544 RepID=A0A5J5F5G0_9PEZI|nr:putative pheromone processing carboxypeptidase [Sphaerosporella brunnea]KAA8911787.1 putative pheromone processing carboxypeptidase [Sphaerosporella brunnea]